VGPSAGLDAMMTKKSHPLPRLEPVTLSPALYATYISICAINTKHRFTQVVVI